MIILVRDRDFKIPPGATINGQVQDWRIARNTTLEVKIEGCRICMEGSALRCPNTPTLFQVLDEIANEKDPNFPGVCPSCKGPAYFGVVPAAFECKRAKEAGYRECT